MKSNPQSKWLVILVLILLVTNAASLYFLYNREERMSKREQRHSAIVQFLKKDVGFSDAQMQRFENLSKQHREKSEPLFEETANKKEQILKDAAAENLSDSAMAKAASGIALEQEHFEQIMLGHLKQVRSICTPEQLPKFDSGFYKLIVKRGPKPNIKNKQP